MDTVPARWYRHRPTLIIPRLIPTIPLVLGLVGSWRLPWYDERFTLLLARLSLRGMLDATAGDVHPPLYYMLVWGWMRVMPDAATASITAQAFWLRVPSVIAAVVSVMLYAALLREMRVVRPRFVGALSVVFALNGMLLYFAAEGRMYTLLLALTLAALYYGRRRAWLPMAAVNVAMLYTHNYALFYLPVQAGYLLARERLHWRLALAYIVPAGLYGPWAAVLYRQAAAVHDGYWITPPRVGADVLATLAELLWSPAAGLVTVAGVTAVTVGLGWLAYQMLFDRHLALRCAPLWYLASAPMLLAAATSYLVQPVWLWRGLIGCTPWLVTLLWCAWMQDGRRALGWLVFAAPLMVYGVGVAVVLRPAAMRSDPIHDLVAGQWRSGDVVYTINDGQSVHIRAALPDLPLYQMPDCPGSHDRGALTSQTRNALGIVERPLDAIRARRVWLLYDVSYVTDPCRLARADALTAGLAPVLTTVANAYNVTQVYLINNGQDR